MTVSILFIGIRSLKSYALEIYAPESLQIGSHLQGLEIEDAERCIKLHYQEIKFSSFGGYEESIYEIQNNS